MIDTLGEDGCLGFSQIHIAGKRFEEKTGLPLMWGVINNNLEGHER